VRKQPGSRGFWSRRWTRSTTLTAALAAALIAPVSAAASVTPAQADTAKAALAAAGTGPDGGLSVDEAVAQARRTGKAVAIPASTTANSTMTANTDGTLTYSASASPQRKKVDGQWTSLDATLVRRPDGSIGPNATTLDVTLGGRGSSRLLTQGSGPNAFSLDLPFTLPAPSLSGATATYANVLEGVDLVVTVSPQGSFSEVFVVKNAAAATNPALSSLVLSTPAGTTLTSDAAGNLTAATTDGRVIATAVAPTMWDSAEPVPAVSTLPDPTTGRAIDSATGAPVTSSVDAPGENAHVAPVATAVSGRSLTLIPSTSLLSASSTEWPVYIDPSYTNPHTGGDDTMWATVRSAFPTTSYVKTSDPLSVGYQGWESPVFKSRAFIQFPLSSKLYGSTVIKAQVQLQETYSPSCSARQVDLFHTSVISSSTTWDHQPTQGQLVGTVNAAHGYNNSCLAAEISFDDAKTDSTHLLTDIMQLAADDKWTKAPFGLYAHDESDKYAWKKFDSNSANIDITYDHAPKTLTATSMSTSPQTIRSPYTSCASPASAIPTIGKGDVSFQVTPTDPDGGTVGVAINVFKSGNGATPIAGTSSTSTAYMGPSGKNITFKVAQSTLDANAKDSSGAPVPTTFYWWLRVYDGYFTSGKSPYCNFIYDPSIPGAPSISDPTGTVAMKTPTTLTISPPTSGTLPAKYQWNLNGAPAQTVTADATGTAMISVTPTRLKANVVSAVGVSPGGNIGTQVGTTNPFDADPPATFADNDLNGDGAPDQLTVGASTGTPAPGLWLATGTGTTGAFTTATTNIGAQGVQEPGAATDFNDSKAVTGLFTGGPLQGGTQDQLAYYPSTGLGRVLPGNGDGTLIPPALVSVAAPTFTNDAGYHPTQVVNGGHTVTSGSDFPDLLATAAPTSGSLALYIIPNANSAGAYWPMYQLTNPTPTGTSDWTNWQMASAQTSTGTDLYLWNTSTKTLYLWRGLAYTDNGDGTGQVTGTQYTVAATWNPATVNSLEAADLNADGLTDLRVINTSGVATPYLISALPAGTALGTPGTPAATVTTKTAQTLTW
jgi:hypothetical protein